MSGTKELLVSHLTFSFTSTLAPIFDSLSTRFSAKKLNFIKGRNGSGKSTLLRLLQGRIYAKEILEGTITLDEQQYNLQSDELFQLASHVGLVQQDFKAMLVPTFTFQENVRFVYIARLPGLKKLPIKTAIPSIVKQLAIPMTTPVRLLSGGQQQILAITMMLQQPKQVLLLDEPTAALDEKNSHLVIQFLQNLCVSTDIIIVIVSHDKELVETYAQDGYWVLKNKKMHFSSLPS